MRLALPTLTTLAVPMLRSKSATPLGSARLPFTSVLRVPKGAQGEQPGEGPLLDDGPGAGARQLGHAAEPESAPAPRRRAHDADLEPAARHAAQLAPPVTTPVAPTAAPALAEAAPVARARASLEDLLPALVRRVAWSGDGKRGTVRLELGAGALAGATLLVHTDEGRVRVHLSAPPGVDLEGWRTRIASRLAGRGLDVAEVEVG